MAFRKRSELSLAVLLALATAGCTLVVESQLTRSDDAASGQIDAAVADGGTSTSSNDGSIASPVDSGTRASDAATTTQPVDGGTNPGTDSAVTDVCAGASDGTACGSASICLNEVCGPSVCGDGLMDSTRNEQCDDENDVDGDGCDSDCTFSCASNSECDDGAICNGAEECDMHRCRATTPLADGTMCPDAQSAAGVCRSSECVAPGCGNGVPDGAEECDDGNDSDADGCDSDCTFSCTVNADCDDGNVCNGMETCVVATHRCAAGTPMVCVADNNACTNDLCDASMGCIHPLIDTDGDGFAPNTLGACGLDCNDMRADINPDQPELCNDALDSNCDGDLNPPNINTWYADCDGDGYAQLGASTRESCDEPPATSQCAGGWTTRVPIMGNVSSYDCLDSNELVRPNQTALQSTAISGVSTAYDYDYNCDRTETREYTSADTSATSCVYLNGICDPRTGLCKGGGCVGSSYWVDRIVPACGVAASLSRCTERLILCLNPPCSPSCSRTTATVTQRCR